MKILTKSIRVLTIAPVMALVILIALVISQPARFGEATNFWLSLVFLVIFPLLGYPFQKLIPPFKHRGREGQRTLAMIFAVAGYILGCLFALAFGAPAAVWIIYLSYLFSGILICLVNKAFYFKASGHSCGITGPFAILVSFGNPLGLIGIPILAVTWLSSLYMKRHTNAQLAVGAMIPVVVLAMVTALVSLV